MASVDSRQVEDQAVASALEQLCLCTGTFNDLPEGFIIQHGQHDKMADIIWLS